jgi:hypothetical protein
VRLVFHLGLSRRTRCDKGSDFWWTYCAIDAETKLVPTFKCGKRHLTTTTEFVHDVASRMRNRVQISTDALHGYVESIERSRLSGHLVRMWITDRS